MNLSHSAQIAWEGEDYSWCEIVQGLESKLQKWQIREVVIASLFEMVRLRPIFIYEWLWLLMAELYILCKESNGNPDCGAPNDATSLICEVS